MATTDTTHLSYWLNWRFLISGTSVLGFTILSLYIIFKKEGKKKRSDDHHPGQVSAGVLYTDELWKTCLKEMHPIWLLLYRLIALCVLLALLVGNTVVAGPRIFYYYTQWTFTLTTLYFGIALGFSFYGFCHAPHEACHVIETTSPNSVDAEQQSNGVVPKIGSSQNADASENLSNNNGDEVHARQIAGFTGYLFQIIFQVAAGAVLLTDVVYWFILYLLLTPKNKKKLQFFNVCMHSVNVLILGDAVLNCMRFPMFRIAYFSLWTSMFVICQWIIHVFVSMPWPYPFMDLSPPFSPLWYVAVGLLQVPCYGLFALIVKLKGTWLSRSFPDSYQVLR